MKTVRFVIGLPHSGKSTARTSTPELASLPYLDLYDIQQEFGKGGCNGVEEIWRSYEIALERLLAMLDEHDDVVFEHTLVKSKRRPFYIDGIREAYPDARLVCYYSYPDIDEYLRRCSLKREGQVETRGEVRPHDDDDKEISHLAKALIDAVDKAISASEKRYREMHSIFDIPTLEEGFDEIIDVS